MPLFPFASVPFRLQLAGVALLFAVLPCSAQLVINYTNNQVNQNAHSTSAPDNPLTLNLDYGYANQQGVISGTGALIKTGAGRLLLHDGVGSNTYSGGTTLVKTGTGSLTLSGHHSYTGTTSIEAGTLIVNGSLAEESAVAITSGGTLAGRGRIGDLTIADGGTISPGNSSGTLTTGSEVWNPGGTYLWELNDASDDGSAKGVTYDWLNILGTLELDDLDPGSFTISITSLTTGNIAGLASGFDPEGTYHWIIATAASISGFQSDRFTIETGGFANAPETPYFSISSNGTDLVLNYSPVPEPATFVTVLAGLLGLMLLLRRRSS